MTSRFTLPLAALAIASMTPLMSAQTQSLPKFPAPAPTQGPEILYDVTTGQQQILPQAAGGVQKTLVRCFDNGAALFSGFFTVATTGLEFVDWGVKGCSTTGVVDSIDIGYATTALDVGAFGPGASLDIAIFKGTTGFGTLGTEITRIALTGLPGSADGVTPAAFAVTVTLTSSICVGDGPIGWSYVGVDGVTGPLLQFTPSANGTVDAFDLYTAPAPIGPFIGTFAFGTPGIASFWIAIDEQNGASSSALPRNGTFVNPDIWLAPIPILSQPWATVFDLTGVPGATFTGVGLSKGSATGPILTFGELLIDLADPTLIINTSVATGGALSPHTLMAPKSLSLIGDTLNCQGAYFDGTIVFTNAIDIIMDI